jgi:hypothetical protein
VENILLQIGGLLLSYLTVILGYLKFQDSKKAQREKEREKQREEKEKLYKLQNERALSEFRVVINEDIREIMNKTLTNYPPTWKIIEDNDKIVGRLKGLEEGMNETRDQLRKAEIQGLGIEIMKYAEDLRNNMKKSRNSYQHIAEAYDRYKELGGNHYVDIEFEYIKEAMENAKD